MCIFGYAEQEKFKGGPNADRLQKGPNLIEIGAFLLIHRNADQGLMAPTPGLPFSSDGNSRAYSVLEISRPWDAAFLTLDQP